MTLSELLARDDLTDTYKYHYYINNTAEWRDVREMVLDRDNHRCRCCGRTDDLTVHHSTYEHLYHEIEHPDDLITLCRVCHNAVHRAKSNIPRFKKPKPNRDKQT